MISSGNPLASNTGGASALTVVSAIPIIIGRDGRAFLASRFRAPTFPRSVHFRSAGTRNAKAHRNARPSLIIGVVEPFQLDLALAPACQDAGSGSTFSSNTSSSSVVHHFCHKNCEKFPVLLYRGLFYSQKATRALLCPSSISHKETDYFT